VKSFGSDVLIAGAGPSLSVDFSLNEGRVGQRERTAVTSPIEVAIRTEPIVRFGVQSASGLLNNPQTSHQTTDTDSLRRLYQSELPSI